MRTTIRLEESLLRQAKAVAAASGRSLNDFIADAVRAAVLPRGPKAAARSLPTFRGAGLRPGVDLDDTSALIDLMSEGSGLQYASTERPARKVAERSRKRPTDR